MQGFNVVHDIVGIVRALIRIVDYLDLLRLLQVLKLPLDYWEVKVSEINQIEHRVGVSLQQHCWLLPDMRYIYFVDLRLEAQSLNEFKLVALFHCKSFLFLAD